MKTESESHREPDLVIPESIRRDRTDKDFAPMELIIYIPIPNTIDEGIYLTMQEFITVLRANKNNPDGIEYLADMLE